MFIKTWVVSLVMYTGNKICMLGERRDYGGPESAAYTTIKQSDTMYSKTIHSTSETIFYQCCWRTYKWQLEVSQTESLITTKVALDGVRSSTALGIFSDLRLYPVTPWIKVQGMFLCRAFYSK